MQIVISFILRLLEYLKVSQLICKSDKPFANNLEPTIIKILQ